MNPASRIIVGDVLDVLPTLPEQSVHCVVTSPPFWGLRDYGTATWEGGDDGCDHKCGTARNDGGKADPYGFHGSLAAGSDKGAMLYADTCGKCGARRIDKQLGLEPTPDEYVAKMVEVFRGVWRVLRDDGVLWLNLGSSYASSNMRPNQSHSGARACGNDGTVPQGSQAAGRACPCCGGELQGDSVIRRGRTDCNTPQTEQPEQHPLQTSRGSEHLDCAGSSLAASSPDAQPSTNPSSSVNALDASSQPATVSAAQLGSGTSSTDEPQFSDNSACTDGTSQNAGRSVSRSLDTAFSCVACGYCSSEPLQFKPKDLIPIPWMVAMALQQDGWFLRDCIIWWKPSPMPGSQRDRCTSSYEFVFQLTKRSRYYFDMEAIKEPCVYAGKTTHQKNSRWGDMAGCDGVHRKYAMGGHDGRDSRIPRNVWKCEWSDEDVRALVQYMNMKPPGANVWKIASGGFKLKHFATFPVALPTRCIKASTSERGCCPECGAGWVRVVERDRQPTRGMSGRDWNPKRDDTGMANRDELRHVTETKTVGWERGCECVLSAPISPAIVLDPFAGAGTTGIAALNLGREFIGIELNPEYAQMARDRITRETRPHTGRTDEAGDAPLFVEQEATRRKVD